MKRTVLGGLVAALLGMSMPASALDLPAAAPAGTPLSSRDLPAVPAKLVAEARQTPPRGADAPVVDCNQTSSVEIVVSPGENTLVCVAVNHLNRIVVPWANPVVRTTSAVQSEVHGNVMYVATSSKEPESFYVLREGSEEVAVSLTLVPFQIPGREIRLKVSQDLMPAVADNTAAAKWEQSQPYVETLLSGLAEIARGHVPQGYQLRQATGRDRAPACAMPAGLNVDFREGQVLVGSNLEIVIGLVTNSGVGADLSEPWCVTSQVVAVAFWPRIHLNTGERTEVYIVRRRGAVAPSSEGRPSLLGGQL